MNRVLPDAFLCALDRGISLPEAWQWQRAWQKRLIEAQQADAFTAPELLLLLEHTACYTLGRGSDLAHLHFDPEAPPAPLHRIDRGGEVTHHLPGQLVAYPVLDLQRHRCDLHWYLRQLEGGVLDLLQELGLEGERRDGLTGVWLEGCKVASIGVGAKRWVTQHGLALNVSCELSGFACISPCGLQLPVGSLQQRRPDLTVEQVQRPLARVLTARLGWDNPHWINEQTLLSEIGADG